ncbi:MAG: FAD-dependent oxidoreductase [Rhodospirillales bacterium]|jgi:sarcosine oxidase subunit beta|nr:FAD-dependent oxidoreductase [Rhodospirillales bacterium]
MSDKYDAIIIGAGILGAPIGFELAKKGWKTLNVDTLPAAGYGSTSNSCAHIRLHYSTYDGAAIAYEGYHYWKDWENYLGVEDERGLAKFVDSGCVLFKSELNNYLKPLCENFDKMGIKWEDWDAETLGKKIAILDPHSFWPVRRPDDPGFGEPSSELIAGAIFYKDGGYINDPQLSTHNVQRAAEAKGAGFRFNSKVVEIRRDGDRVVGVTLENGDAIDAPVVVNVAGPHSYIVNRMAGVEKGMNIKTRALKHEVCHVPAPEGFDFGKHGSITNDSDIGCYYRPVSRDHMLIGSVDPECDEHEWVDPDDYDKNFTEQWTVQVMRLAQRMPGLKIPNQAKGVVDLYDVSDDWIPIYDKSDLGGFYMAVGTSGNQYKNGPVVGAMMAELIERCEQGLDHDAEPLQFTMKYTGLTINAGFYSRLREINPDSSFSVVG